MANIAVICEGVSEYNIINHIVSRYNPDYNLNPVQPKINQATGTQADNGGWARVLEHCNDVEFDNIFQLNDYLIIQIDTDSSHIEPYAVRHVHNDGTPKSHKRLHAEIKARLMRDLSSETKNKYLSRIIFAICHNEIECWLLPLYYDDNRACRTHNCIYTLNKELSRQNIPCIPEKQKNSPNAQKAYRRVLKNIRNREGVIRLVEKSQSWGFSSFIKGLDSV